MPRFLIGLLLGLFIASTCSARPLVLTPAVTRVTQPCVEKASILAALMPTLAESRRLMVRDKWEYGGFIYRDALGRYCITDPATSKHPYALRFLRINPEGAMLVGIYHTHPGLEFTAHYFSATDVMTACLLKVRSFIVSEDQIVTEFRPHTAICTMPDLGNTPGRIVGMVKS